MGNGASGETYIVMKEVLRGSCREMNNEHYLSPASLVCSFGSVIWVRYGHLVM